MNRFFGASMTGRLLGIRATETSMPGNHATPFQGHLLQTATREATFAPSYHFVTDMSEQVARTNLPGGPSENAFSKWYQSDIDRWLGAEYKELKVGQPGDA